MSVAVAPDRPYRREEGERRSDLPPPSITLRAVKTLEETPPDATHWSTRQMAKATGMSQTAIRRIWGAFGLKPHLAEHFKLSPDPQFIDKVRDIAAHPEKAPADLGQKKKADACVCTQLRSFGGHSGSVTHTGAGRAADRQRERAG